METNQLHVCGNFGATKDAWRTHYTNGDFKHSNQLSPTDTKKVTDAWTASPIILRNKINPQIEGALCLQTKLPLDVSSDIFGSDPLKYI